MKITIGEALREARQCLERSRISESRAAAEVLLADLLRMPRARLYLESRRLLCANQYASYVARIRRRQGGEPVQYITGRQEFWSLEFAVNRHVLIPRPESELLVEHSIRLLQRQRSIQTWSSLSLLDVGTGSGNLAICLARAFPESRVWAVDRTLAALHVARHNAQRLGVANRLQWLQGDLLTAFRDSIHRFALCVSNLPYVTTAEWEQLPRDIRAYEPPEALRGGEDGLALIRRLILASPDVLAAGGGLLLEIGWKQADRVVRMLRQTERFRQVEVYRDFGGIERVVWAQVP